MNSYLAQDTPLEKNILITPDIESGSPTRAFGDDDEGPLLAVFCLTTHNSERLLQGI